MVLGFLVVGMLAIAGVITAIYNSTRIDNIDRALVDPTYARQMICTIRARPQDVVAGSPLTTGNSAQQWGEVRFMREHSDVLVRLQNSDPNLVALKIHGPAFGSSGTNAAPVVTLWTNPGGAAPSDIVGDIDVMPATMTQLFNAPSLFYVLATNPADPGGSARGNLDNCR